ncbi:MAG: transposase [Candidatus Omnitrophica bacterium]|nr:transposase [Candidatus Omnitrophota bacterium]
MEEVYHVYNKSIAGFTIFNNDIEYLRMMEAVCYYQHAKPAVRFSLRTQSGINKKNSSATDNGMLVEIVAYCLMPTHLHLVLRQLCDRGISRFLNNILNSYTRYFNIRHNRKGPLWEGRTKKTLIKTDEQLLHLTRYLHLNPVTSYLVNKPEEWSYSSYREYLSEIDNEYRICKYNSLLTINPNIYKAFVEDAIFYQRELAMIKKSLPI